MKITNTILVALAVLHSALPASAAPFMEYQGPAKAIPKSISMDKRVPISIVKINPGSASPGISSTVGFPGESEMEIRLSRDLQWKVKITGYKYSKKESWAATGTLAGNSSGYASIGYSNGTYVMNIVDLSRNESYGVMPIGGGTYLSYLQETDGNPFCASKDSRKTSAFSKPVPGRKSSALSAEDSLIVDMAFYWSPDAADALGGDEAVKAHINRNVLDLNEALKRSGGKGEWRVGLAQRIDPSGIEGAPSILEYAGRSSAPVFDSLVAETCLRGLDYTQIIVVKGFPPDIAGMNHSSLSYVGAKYMTNGTSVHEAGHSLGCSHERTYYPDRGESRSQYAFGFDGLDSSGAVMRCLMYHRSGPYIIPYFSNPTITVRGTKIGTPIGALDSIGRKNSADCAEQIRRYGATEVATNSSSGLTIGGYKKYGAIPPGGAQEYWLKIGNISSQELSALHISVRKDKGDSLISSDPPGTLLGDTYILWDIVGRVAPGEFLKPTYFESVIRFKIKPGPGKNEIGELSYSVQNTGFLNQESISPTPVDPNARISFKSNRELKNKFGFQTSFSSSRHIDLKFFPKGVVTYNLKGSSSIVNEASLNRDAVYPVFGWRTFRKIEK